MKTENFTKEQAALILKIRDALALKDVDEAYHCLYQIASPNFDKTDPWGELERIAASGSVAAPKEEPKENETVNEIDLIAVFDGWQRDDKNTPVEYTSWCKKGCLPAPYSWLKQHYSEWNGIMSVVHKAWDISDVDKREINTEGLEIFELGILTPIEDVRKALVQFINWFNLQKK